MHFSITMLMFLMLPWFFGHVACIFMDGDYISTAEQHIINIVGAFTVPEKYGLWSIATSGYELFTDTLARIFLWDYSFFSGAYAFLRWLLLFVLTIPFIVGFIFAMKSLAEGVFR